MSETVLVNRDEAPGDAPSVDIERLVMDSSSVAQAEPPAEIFIAPWGEVQTLAGSFVLDEKAAAATIAAFEAHGTDVPVDYEHQTLGGSYSSPTGQAPAAGWIKALSLITPAQAAARGGDVQPGLWARVEWTEEASAKLRGRQYRYLSPVALVRRSDRRLVGLHSVALTNKPAIVGMRPLIGSDDGAASPDVALACASQRLRGLLQIAEGESDDLVLLAAAERIELLESRERLREAGDRVAAAMSAGKLTAAQKPWALTLAERDPAEFDRWAACAPVVVPLGRVISPEPPSADSTAKRSAEATARSEYRANRAFLEKLCTEEAYVANAARLEVPAAS